MKLRKIINENTKLTEDQKNTIIERVAGLNEYQKTFQEVGKLHGFIEELQKIAETASHLAITEADDWFEQTQIKRDMKEVKNASNQLEKVKEEMKSVMFKAHSLYEDIGYKLGKYFDINEPDADDEDRITEKL
jgi:hypothetical protein